MIYTRYHFVFAFLLGAQSTWAEKNVPFMNQVRSTSRLNETSVENTKRVASKGFQFDYTPTTQPVPIPTTGMSNYSRHIFLITAVQLNVTQYRYHGRALRLRRGELREACIT